MLPDKLNCLVNLALFRNVGMRKYYRRCILYLVVEKLTEVFHIHFAFTGINNRCERVQNGFFGGYLLYCSYNVGKLTNSRRLNNYSVGIIFFKNFSKGFSEITHERTAYTARIHFGNLYTCVLQKSPVYSNLTEFIFYKHHTLTGIGFLYKLFYKCSFTCTEKA